MIVATILLWVVAVFVLAGRGYKFPWLAALLAFPLLTGVVFALDPSFRGPDSRDYLPTGAVVAGMVWMVAGLASTVAWFMGKRVR